MFNIIPLFLTACYSHNTRPRIGNNLTKPTDRKQHCICEWGYIRKLNTERRAGWAGLDGGYWQIHEDYFKNILAAAVFSYKTTRGNAQNGCPREHKTLHTCRSTQFFSRSVSSKQYRSAYSNFLVPSILNYLVLPLLNYLVLSILNFLVPSILNYLVLSLLNYLVLSILNFLVSSILNYLVLSLLNYLILPILNFL